MHADCPFCLQNQLLKMPVVAETDAAFAIGAQRFPGCYLIVPKAHVESLADLPDDWWQHFKTLCTALPGQDGDYNISINMGVAAGQTIPHIHFWFVPRAEGEPATGKGLATLIGLCNTTS